MTRFLFIAALAASSSVASAQAVTVTLTEFKLGLSRDTVKAGPVTFNITNDGTMNHGFFVRGGGLAKGSKELPKGETANLTVTLKPGTYDVYCPLSDGSHRKAGMEKKLVVVAGDASKPKKPGA
ncbi:MAG: cupredoxin domain-containing protein [Gemmatimonadaceae bacterium]